MDSNVRTRVAIFTDSNLHAVNGLTTTLNAVLRHLPSDLAVRVYTAADLASDCPDYFAVPSIGVGLPWYREMRVYWPRIRQFAKALTADRIDVVHIATPGPVGLAGRLLARRLALPLTGSYHAMLGPHGEALRGSSRLGRTIEHYMRWLYGACESILVPTRATGDHLARMGYPQERIRMWSRGVDTQMFAPERRSARLRNRWHVDDRRPVVLYAGRLSRAKGLEMLPGIDRWLYSQRVAHRMVLVGDGPMAAELRERCPEAEFLGCVAHDAVAEAMASADVFVLPSAIDTLGNVVLEAQASGLPVVVSDAGGPREMMIDGITGLVAPAGDAAAFGNHVMRLLRGVSARHEMSLRARSHAMRHSWAESVVPLVRSWRNAAGRITVADQGPTTNPQAVGA